MKNEITIKTGEESIWISERCLAMVDQFKRKNTAYGNSFGVQFEKYGSISALVRLSDKFSRIEALMLGAENGVSDERLEDTLVDMACYCMMTLYEMQKDDVVSISKRSDCRYL